MHGGLSAGADDAMPGFDGGGGGLVGASNEVPGLASGRIGSDVEAGVGADLWLMPD